MTQPELSILNSLVTYVAENIPGGLNSKEQEVAKIVGQWAIDGLPVRPCCPYCHEPLPHDAIREPWLEHHVNNPVHRWRWRARETVYRLTHPR